MDTHTSKDDGVKTSPSHLISGAALAAIGVALAAGGIYVGETDDAPGAAVMGILLMIGLIALGVRMVRGIK